MPRFIEISPEASGRLGLFTWHEKEENYCGEENVTIQSNSNINSSVLGNENGMRN